MTANRKLLKAAAENGIKVGLYMLRASNGKPIHKATKVIFADGREVKFLERMPMTAAIRQALAVRFNDDAVSLLIDFGYFAECAQ